MYPSASRYHEASYPRHNIKRKRPSMEREMDRHSMPYRKRPKLYGINHFEGPKMQANRVRSRHAPYPARSKASSYAPKSRVYKMRSSTPSSFMPTWDQQYYQSDYDDLYDSQTQHPYPNLYSTDELESQI